MKSKENYPLDKATVGKTDRKAGLRAIEMGSYSNPGRSKRAYTGWVQPQGPNAQWLLLTQANGDAVLYKERERNGAVVGDAQLLRADPPKDPRKEFHMEVSLFATGKRRKANVSTSFNPGLHYYDEEAYNKVHAALREFCQHLIDRGEL